MDIETHTARLHRELAESEQRCNAANVKLAEDTETATATEAAGVRERESALLEISQHESVMQNIKKSSPTSDQAAATLPSAPAGEVHPQVRPQPEPSAAVGADGRRRDLAPPSAPKERAVRRSVDRSQPQPTSVGGPDVAVLPHLAEDFPPLPGHQPAGSDASSPLPVLNTEADQQDFVDRELVRINSDLGKIAGVATVIWQERTNSFCDEHPWGEIPCGMSVPPSCMLALYTAADKLHSSPEEEGPNMPELPRPVSPSEYARIKRLPVDTGPSRRLRGRRQSRCLGWLDTPTPGTSNPRQRRGQKRQLHPGLRRAFNIRIRYKRTYRRKA